jgi:preprotein translocase subunit SecF
MGIQLIRHDINIDFIGKRHLSFAISLVLLVLSVAGFFVKGLNYGIDFRGGYVIEARFDEDPNVAQLREKLSASYHGNFSLQQFGTDGKDVVVKMERLREGDGVVQQTPTSAAQSIAETAQAVQPNAGTTQAAAGTAQSTAQSTETAQSTAQAAQSVAPTAQSVAQTDE